MRSTLAAVPFAFLMAAAAFLPARTLHADEGFDVTVAGAKVSVVAKSGWHINKDYPWKLVLADKKLDKSHFTISETQATIADAPKGHATLKGAVCSADNCLPFAKEIDVK